ncbi:hypothetical protein, partial [Neptuniibacter sp.]|uniref:hypothetical protein n=1 Tax=Neptuniibacter sp. TaxID=1962643 RepID=UPI00263247E0
FQNRGFRGNCPFNSCIVCQNCGINGHHSSVCWRPVINNYPYYNQQTFSLLQTHQALPPSPARPVLPALLAPPAQPAVTVPNNTRNYVRPVTAIQSVSAEASNSSLQVQARDEEIELLHAQIECLQQTNFPEFITVNSQATVPPTNSLGAACAPSFC